ncbi:preprotein translocase subunit SecG [Calditrichota bacterium LG25]
MYTLLIILFVLVSIVMVVVILLQSGKGQGLAGSIGGGMGGGPSVFGGRGAADFLSKATAWIATIYFVLAIVISVLYKSHAESTQKSLIEKRMEQQKQIPAPHIPVAPIEGQENQQPANQE